MSAAILGIGTALPGGLIRQEDAAELAAVRSLATDEQKRMLAAIYRRSGVRTRATSLLSGAYDAAAGQDFFPPPRDAADRGPTTGARLDRYAESSARLAFAAARAALSDADLASDRITHLVTVSCTGFFSPGIDTVLPKILELPPTVARTHIGFMGCHGAINGLRVAQAFAESDPRARVLLVAVELCSLHFQYGWSEDSAIANALFGDGAAACVLARSDAAPSDAWTLDATGSRLLPDSADAMSWRIGDHGFEMTLSSRVPALLERHLRPWLDEWLSSRGTSPTDVRSWAIHPGGPRVIDAVLHALELPETAVSASRAVLAEHGNMSSPTVLFILDRLRRNASPRPCVALAFGPGLVAEAALLT